MALNVKLLRKVKRHILAEPKRVDMSLFAYQPEVKGRGQWCGTVGCIAGWTVLLSTPRSQWRKVLSGGSKFIAAARILGIPYRQAWDELFTANGIYGQAGTKEQAREVAKRIDKFIAADRS